MCQTSFDRDQAENKFRIYLQQGRSRLQPRHNVRRFCACFGGSLNLPVSLLLCAVIGTFAGRQVQADEHSEALKKYLTDDVIAVAYFDLARINPKALLEQAHQIGALDDLERTQYEPAASFAISQLELLQKSGIQFVYLLFRATDLSVDIDPPMIVALNTNTSASSTKSPKVTPPMGPSIVIPLAPGTKASTAAAAVRKIVTLMPEPFRNLKVQAGDGVVFVTASERQMKRLMAGNESNEKLETRDLSAGWQAVGSGSAGLLVFGDNDSRRVIRELLPELPSPFDRLNGRLIADDLNWAGIQLTLPPNLNLKLEFETRNDQGNGVLAEAIRNGIDLLGSRPEFQSLMPDAERSLVLRALQPVQSRTRTSVSLDDVTGDFDRVSRLLVPQVLKVREAARETQEMNNLRQLALAFHNYASAYGKFPRSDGKSEQYPAGLSWRVHLLPYLEQGELYKKFKLDEPWDSKHNFALIQQMPLCYRSPLGINREANQNGQTIYQVPISPEAIFQPNADTAGFRDILDGSSNTIMLVATTPPAAAIWTKPDDWEVDLNNPWEGLKSPDRQQVAVALCDASVQRLSLTLKAESLRALITRSGGEVIE